MNMLTLLLRKERKRKDSAGSDDTASMIKGGGYLGARTKYSFSLCVNFLILWFKIKVCQRFVCIVFVW